MLFNSPLYGVFLVVTYVIFWGLRRQSFVRPLFLVAASYLFYFVGTYDAAKEQDVPLGPISWTILCVLVIFVGSSIDFSVGKILGRTENPTKRKLLLLVSIFYYLGALSIFKYFNFAVDSFAQVMAMAGVKVSPVHLRLVLPFGISFFTFETMSYTIDVYRKEIPPCDRYLDYLLFVCFFPHLVAGPIVRPKSMLPQLAKEPSATDAMKAEGLFLIATGLVKKIAIGDVLSQNLVNRVFENPERYSTVEVLVGVYAYAIKIYADFSGYTDVAIGSAKLFGYELPKNFDSPYKSADLQEFWHRWHISLSTWLRDYLYIPLGGSKGSTFLTYRNLMLTMVLGGLWHGASWNFVIWGALHGGGLAITRAWQRAHHVKRPLQAIGAPYRDPVPTPERTETPLQGMMRRMKHRWSVILTFHFVCLAWVFFKAPSFAHAMALLARFRWRNLGYTTPNLVPWVMAVLVLGFVAHFFPKNLYERIKNAFITSPAVVQGVVLAAFAYAIHFAAGAKSEPFIYGQF